MSTAGKVLVVLILISSLVWLVLASKVAVINANGAQMRDKFEQDFAKLEADSAQNRINLRLLKDQIAHTQVQMDRDLAVIRSRVAELEKARSGLLEVAARAKHGVDTINATIEAAGADLALRKAENSAEQTAFADLQNEVKRLQEEHGQLSDQLTQLRDQLKSTLSENRSTVQRLMRGPSARRNVTPSATIRN